MGVNAVIVLPGSVHVEDVANVMGILAGCALTIKPRCNESTPFNVPEVAGVTIKGGEGDMAACPSIAFLGHRVLFFFEPGAPNWGKRMMLPDSTGFWIAVGRALVEFFGGSLRCADYSSTVIFEHPEASDLRNDGNSVWVALQQRICEVKPLTSEQIAKGNLWAAYRTPIPTRTVPSVAEALTAILEADGLNSENTAAARAALSAAKEER